MRRSAAAALAAAFSLCPAAVLAGTRIAVPGGTPIPVRMADTISPATANVGDSFEFKADDNVVVNGYVVVARGAEGRGQITSVDRAGGHGHSGNLGVKFDYVYAVDGEKVRLSAAGKTASALLAFVDSTVHVVSSQPASTAQTTASLAEISMP